MRTLLAALLLSTACTSAHADRVARPAVAPRTAIAVAPDSVRAPYDVQILTESGETAPTYAMRGRYYVQGRLDERYTIRVTNPTGRRVEAVVSVDGLDVVDGEAGDLDKRGYIVPAYGEVRIEGFRTSLSDVATFRFSSVDGSYAGRKGKARNVGVIAVALFEEQAPPEPQVIVDDVPMPPRPYPSHGRHSDGAGAPASAPAKRAAVPDRDEVSSAAGEAGGAAPSGAARPAPSPPPRYEVDGYREPSDASAAQRSRRAGLGTEFGEQRYSAVSYTRFVRAGNRPIAIAELRYNDAAGLIALGIPLQPAPDEGEIMMRETADPFPGDRFARPPGR